MKKTVSLLAIILSTLSVATSSLAGTGTLDVTEDLPSNKYPSVYTEMELTIEGSGRNDSEAGQDSVSTLKKLYYEAVKKYSLTQVLVAETPRVLFEGREGDKYVIKTHVVYHGFKNLFFTDTQFMGDFIRGATQISWGRDPFDSEYIPNAKKASLERCKQVRPNAVCRHVLTTELRNGNNGAYRVWVKADVK